jgi:ABC-type branched-subunit amino acid transport system ATPase component
VENIFDVIAGLVKTSEVGIILVEQNAAIGQRIRQYRTSRKLSQQRLAGLKEGYGNAALALTPNLRCTPP